MARPSLRQPQTRMRTGYGLGCVLFLALVAARPADAQPAPTWSERHGLRFAVTQGTTTCPADTVPVTHTFAQELEQ